MIPDTLYIDPHRRFAVGYFSETPVDLCIGVDTSDWDGIEGIHVLRAVFSLDDLQEKIAILDDDLDDVAIERLKYILTHVIRPGKMGATRDLRFAARTRVEPWRDDVLHGRLHFLHPHENDRAVVNSEIPIMWYYDQVYACQVDPRMKLPEGVAPVVDARAMQLRLGSGDGNGYPYYREEKPDKSGMIISHATFRRTGTRPTIRLAGLNHVTGVSFFPPVFESVEPDKTGRCFIASLNGSPGLITPVGGYSDLYYRHLPPVPEVDLGKYRKDLDRWFSERKMQVYYRDSSAAIPLDRDGEYIYRPGSFIRAGRFVDTTSRGGRPAPDVKTRYLIISNRGVKLQDIPGIADQNPSLLMWDLTMFDYNAIFYVLDLYPRKGVCQVALLHVPQSLPGIYMDNIIGNALGNIDRNYEGIWPEGSRAARMKRLSVAANETFLADLDSEEVNPLSINAQWRARTAALLGIAPNNRLIDLAPLRDPQDETVEVVRELLEVEGALADVEPSYTLVSRPSPLFLDDIM